jgi:uncharacterized caspase-like protein
MNLTILNIKAFLHLLAILIVINICISIPIKAQIDSRRDMQLQPTTQINAWPAKEKRFALIIGIDEYQDEQIVSLKGAVNDAKALAQVLVENAGFSQHQVILLTSDQPASRRPTRSNILRQLFYLLNAITQDGKNGLLLVAFAGHGIAPSEQAYLLPMDVDLAEMERTGINVNEIRNPIKNKGVEQVVLILDACRTGPQLSRSDGKVWSGDIGDKSVGRHR